MAIETIIDRMTTLLSFEQPLGEIRQRFLDAGVSDDLIYLCWVAARMRLAKS